jgi:hypothetical protein
MIASFRPIRNEPLKAGTHAMSTLGGATSAILAALPGYQAEGLPLGKESPTSIRSDEGQAHGAASNGGDQRPEAPALGG